MRTTPQTATPAPPDIVYRFQVEDQKTGLSYFVLVGEDGMAFREAVEEPLQRAG